MNAGAGMATAGASGIPGSEGESITLVQRVYAAVDDTPALLGLCTSDVEFRYPDIGALAYGGTWHGPDQVARFLEAHDNDEEILDFELRELVASGDRVIAFGLFRGRAKPTGRVWTTEFVHAITVEGGRVKRFESFFDTAAALEAHRA